MFLRIQGITIPVPDENARRQPTAAGSRRRAGRGDLNDPRRGVRGGSQFSTDILPGSEADAFEGLLGGRGHVWLLKDGFASGRGLHPEPGYRLIRFDPTWVSTLFPDVPGQMTIDAGANGHFMTIDPQIEDDTCWTFVAYVDGEHQARRGDGAAFDVDGDLDPTILAPGGGTGIFIKMIDGRLFFYLDDASAHTIELMMLFPFIAPADWILQWNGGGFPIGPAPILGADGDFREESKVWLFSETLAQPFEIIVDDGVWDPASRRVPFRLRDVPPQFLRDVSLPIGVVS